MTQSEISDRELAAAVCGYEFGLRAAEMAGRPPANTALGEKVYPIGLVLITQAIRAVKDDPDGSVAMTAAMDQLQEWARDVATR
jgi:hypothetical protein